MPYTGCRSVPRYYTMRFIMPPAVHVGRGALSDTAIRLSVCLSHGAAALGYRHAGCLQLSHVRTADPSVDGRRSAASRTAIGGGGHIVPGAITCFAVWRSKTGHFPHASSQVLAPIVTKCSLDNCQVVSSIFLYFCYQ